MGRTEAGISDSDLIRERLSRTTPLHLSICIQFKMEFYRFLLINWTLLAVASYSYSEVTECEYFTYNTIHLSKRIFVAKPNFVAKNNLYVCF